MEGDERHAAREGQVERAFAAVAASDGWSPDIEWFAADRDGHVALLATAGLGPVPRAALSDARGHVAVWEAIENLHPTVGHADHGTELFDRAGQLGVFSFDYSALGQNYGQYKGGQTYQRVGTPQRAITVDVLGDRARSYLASVQTTDVCFADADSLITERGFRDLHHPSRWDR